MKHIEVKITRLQKRNRKIIIVIESDLYSNEVFAVTPFYDEGDKKNQLQSINFDLKVNEEGGKLDATVNFSSYLPHFTKGHTQLSKPLTMFYLTKKECAKDWFLNEKREYFTESRISQILKLWDEDKDFQNELLDISIKRKKQFKSDDLNEAKKNYQIALDNLNKCLDEIF